MLRSVNPVLGKTNFDNLFPGQGRMTLSGTVKKTLWLVLVAVAAGTWTWSQYHSGMSAEEAAWFGMANLIAAGAAVLLAISTVFGKRYAAIFAPLYAVCEGEVLGALSAQAESKFPGMIVGQSAVLTVATLFGLLIAYRSGVIEATENLKLGIVSATLALAMVYGIDLVCWLTTGERLAFMGASHGGWLAIGFSVLVVGVAAMNLVLDFDFIESGVNRGCPQYMEWYGAFGIMVTLVWMYVSVVKLIGQLRSN